MANPIEVLLQEKRTFKPPEEFARQAVAQAKIHKEAQANPIRFWEKEAKALDWFKPWRKTLEWKPPYAKWFVPSPPSSPSRKACTPRWR